MLISAFCFCYRFLYPVDLLGGSDTQSEPQFICW